MSARGWRIAVAHATKSSGSAVCMQTSSNSASSSGQRECSRGSPTAAARLRTSCGNCSPCQLAYALAIAGLRGPFTSDGIPTNVHPRIVHAWPTNSPNPETCNKPRQTAGTTASRCTDRAAPRETESRRTDCPDSPQQFFAPSTAPWYVAIATPCPAYPSA